MSVQVSRNVCPTRDDPSSGDQLAQITQLREQIANLEKQLFIKDAQQLAKDKQVCGDRCCSEVGIGKSSVLQLARGVGPGDKCETSRYFVL